MSNRFFLSAPKGVLFALVVGLIATILVSWNPAILGDPAGTAPSVLHGNANETSIAMAALCEKVSAALPDVTFTAGQAGYDKSIQSYWAASGREIYPACVVRARDALDVSSAIKTLKTAYDKSADVDDVKFAVRGLSFFSPRFGMACGNIDDYEIVLADGTIVQANSAQNADLWKALKGGSGNFGVVTRITMRTFALDKVWAGYAYWGPWQASKVLQAFYEFNKPEAFDPYAAGPLLAFGYVQKSGMHAIACSLLYTKAEKWPKSSQGFKAVWCLWSTHKIQTITSATDELDRWSPPGFRQFNYPLTIKNDLETFEKCREHYNEGLRTVKNVKGAIWSLIFQPLSAGITRKGDPNVLGLDPRDKSDVLVIVHISVSWVNKKDDEQVYTAVRDIMSKCRSSAEQRGTSDSWLYLNYAASGQEPIAGYGKDNIDFLKRVSAKFDADGLFQRAKRGGFKLDQKSID